MTTREFQFVQGSSNKFWKISLNDTSHTVQYGRIGTVGQSVVKNFATSSEAQKSYEKLISAKLKEGYVELTTPCEANIHDESPTDVPETVAVASTPAPQKAEPETRPAETNLPVPSNLEVKHQLLLSEEDYLWATWRPRSVKTRPAPKPFDYEDCVRRLRKVQPDDWGYYWNWSRIDLPVSMSKEEAHFWLTAFTSTGQIRETNYGRKPKAERLQQMLDFLSSQTFDGNISFLQAAEQVKAWYYQSNKHIVMVLASLFNMLELFKSIIEAVSGNNPYATSSEVDGIAHMVMKNFRTVWLPYASEEELEVLREIVRPHITSANLTGIHNIPPVFYLAAQIGLYNELQEAINSSNPGEPWNNYYGNELQRLVLGLGDPKLVEHHMRRLDLSLGIFNYRDKMDFVPAWLAHTELAALDVIRDSVAKSQNQEQAIQVTKSFAQSVIAPEAAPYMLDIKLSTKGSRAAAEWLEEHPLEAIAGLIPAAAGRDKLAESARDFLRVAWRKGYQDFIEEQLKQAQPEIAARIRSEVIEKLNDQKPPFDELSTPKWIKDTVPTGGRNKLPPWATPANLPPVVVGDKRLNDAQVYGLLVALQGTGLDKKHPFIQALKEHQVGLDNFGWTLFQTWQGEGAVSKEKWALAAVGHLGNDASVFKLAPLVKTWPGVGQHQRAVTGLDCLRAIGTDTALMQINTIAQKAQFKGIKAQAEKAMEQIAQERNLSRDQLEDRIVPDCELDERGTTIFDFGPRQFKFLLGPDMNPMIRDEQGKPKSDLPKPNSKDNAELAAKEVERWKLLKKQIKEVAKLQGLRLEQAMITGRRWKLAEFEQLIVRHPLMVNLARLLVWGGYDETGKLVQTFRVTEEQTYSDSNDDPVELACAQVGIVHPLHLPEKELAEWGQLLSDYEIIPPFPQLGRRVNRLEPGEETLKEITRFKDFKVPAVTLVGILGKASWERGAPQDAGVYYEHTKHFPAANIYAVMEYQGIPIGYMEGWENQSVERCYFVKEHKSWWNNDNKIPLGEVDPVVVSEVLGILYAISSKTQD